MALPRNIEPVLRDIGTLFRNIGSLPRDIETLHRSIVTLPRDILALHRSIVTLSRNIGILPRDIKPLLRDIKPLPRDILTLHRNIATLPRNIVTLPRSANPLYWDIVALPRDILTLNPSLIASVQTMSSPSEEPNTTIVTYRPEFREAFERLNRAWLEAHSLLEPADVEYLQEPEIHILSSGGQIFCALQDGEVVGTCAALRISQEVYELAKLAVAPVAQGQGLGRQLSERVLSFAREAGAAKIELTSHTALVQALRLYESLGFQREPMPPDVRYQTANVYMTLRF